jgi:hypothetical protein
MNDTECNADEADDSFTEASSIDGAPTDCSSCGKALCLRKQVVNLALDNTEEMYCLECLGKINGKGPLEILLATKSYILQRECFCRQWTKYENRSFCPEPLTCYIDECFGQ